jgi:hypothetical protein
LTKEELYTFDHMQKNMDRWVREITSHSHPQRSIVDLIRANEFIDRNEQTPNKLTYGYETSCLPHLDRLARVNCIISSGGGVLFYPRQLIMKLEHELVGKQFSAEELRLFHVELKQKTFQVPDGVFSFHAGLFRDKKNNIVCGALHSSPYLPEHAEDIRLRIMSHSHDKANSISNEELLKWLSEAI